MATHFTEDMLAEQVTAWVGAVDAYRAGDRDRLATHLAGPHDLGDREHYARQVTLCALGAILCATEITQANGHQLGQAPGMYVLQVSPRAGVREPDDLRAVQCITAAANADFGMLTDLVIAYHRPDDIAPGADLLLRLLQIYVSLQSLGGAS